MPQHTTSAARVQSLTRWRAGLAIAAIVLPLALFTLFERQARRLDALAAEGTPVTAHVTGVSRDDRTTYYAYQVDGVEYTWSVARSSAPYAPGEVFPATYLPSDPSFSRPAAEPGLAAAEATRNRSFTWMVVLGLALTLGLFAFSTDRALRRLRSGAGTESSDPAAYKRRLTVMGVALLSAVALIGGFHARDAVGQGQSILPVVIALVLVVGLLGGVFFFVARKGPGEARARAAKLMRWLAPVAVGVAILRLLAFAFGA